MYILMNFQSIRQKNLLVLEILSIKKNDIINF